MTPSKAVIFDLDGTLLDTLADIGNAVNRALSERGFPTHPISRYRDFIGDGPQVLIARALPQEERRESVVSACLADYLDNYAKNFHKETRLFDGVPALLDELTRRHVNMAVLSNKRHDLTLTCVNHYLSRWPLTPVLGMRDGVPKKPDPAGALEIAAAMGVHRRRFAYLGDSGTDMKTARAADMTPIGVLWGTRTQEELEAAGAAAVIRRPLQALDFI